MSRHAREKSETGYYHVIVRGIGKQPLFEDLSDRRYYLMLLEKCSAATSVSVCAYCLMDNHVHLLVCDRSDALSLFMKKLGVSYSAYFNKKYERTGHLFQDRFLSEAINDDPYFLSVYRYILRNPQSASICAFDEYEWSSYRLYGNPESFVDTSLISKMLGSFERFHEFLTQVPEKEHIENDYSRLSDEKAKKLLKNVLGIENGFLLQSYEEAERDAAVRKLDSAGMSERQISRLTGIGRKIIHEILW